MRVVSKPEPNVIDLAAEPIDSPYRQLTLGGRAQFRWTDGKGWKSVGTHWRIANNCFNDLGPSWTDHAEWRIKI